MSDSNGGGGGGGTPGQRTPGTPAAGNTSQQAPSQQRQPSSQQQPLAGMQTPATAGMQTPGVSSHERARTPRTPGRGTTTLATPGSARARRSRSVSRSVDLSGVPLTPASARTPQRTPRSDMGHGLSGQTPSILFRRRREPEPSLTPAGLTPTPVRDATRQRRGSNPNAGADSASLRTPSFSNGSLPERDGAAIMDDPETTFVWGTNVNIAEAQSRFRRFIANFEKLPANAANAAAMGVPDLDLDLDVAMETPPPLPHSRAGTGVGAGDGARGAPKYPDVILDVIRRGEHSVDLDCADLHSYDEELYSQLISYPQEIVPLFDIVVNDIAATLVRGDAALLDLLGADEAIGGGAGLGGGAGASFSSFRLQVRTCNLKEAKTMRGLDPSDVDHLVAVRGMVTHVSSILPDLKQAFFKCSVCGYTPEPVYIDRGNITEPSKCASCNALNSFQMLHNRCLFSNKQQCKMQVRLPS